jgi:hypothetical protein
VRTAAIQAGVSGTLDYVDLPSDISEHMRDPDANTKEIPRRRIGADLRVAYGAFALEGELIDVQYNEDFDDVALDKEFYYATFLLSPNDRLTMYAGYWYTAQNITGLVDLGSGAPVFTHVVFRDRIPGFGVSYLLSDAVVAKAQFGKVDQDIDEYPFNQMNLDFLYYALAMSVMF